MTFESHDTSKPTNNMITYSVWHKRHVGNSNTELVEKTETEVIKAKMQLLQKLKFHYYQTWKVAAIKPEI